MSKVQLPAVKPKRCPWTEGRRVGQKRPLLPKQVWATCARGELAGHPRDLTLFNRALDSQVRVCDLVRLNVADLFVGGSVRDRSDNQGNANDGWEPKAVILFSCRARMQREDRPGCICCGVAQ